MRYKAQITVLWILQITCKNNIEQLAKKFEQNYAVRDKQDVLAMCALQFASKIEQKGIDQIEGTKEAEERLKALSNLVSSKLAIK